MEKIIKGIILSALFLALVSAGTVRAEEAIPDLSMESAPTDELSMDAEPQMSGRIESTGIYFEVKDSAWLNITLSSSELIKLTLESVPNMITMQVESAGGSTSTQITIKGLAPQTTYHKYEDNYHNHEAFTTDDNGSYTYTQYLSAPHTVFIQTHKSTKFIRDDATGGDCWAIGIWDSPTKTCTMTMDLNETIQIDSNGVTLDGNGHTLTGSATGNGIYLYGRAGVTVKDLNVNGFSAGVCLLTSINTTITRVNAANNYYGIYLAYIDSTAFSDNNILADNNTSNNYYGIYLLSANSNTLKNNTALNNEVGISLTRGGDSAGHTWPVSKNTLTGNIMTGNKYNFRLLWWQGIEVDNEVDISNLVNNKPVYFIKNATDQNFDASTNAGVLYCINCNNITIDGLSLTNNYEGVVLYNTQNSLIKNVSVSKSAYGIVLWSSINNTLMNNSVASNSGPGIYLSYSINNTLMNNSVASNSGSGIYLGYSSSSNTLKNNITSNNSMVITGSNNTISGNIIEWNPPMSSLTHGIYITGSKNIISSNTLSSNVPGYGGSYNSAGIYISGWSASENIISDNNVSNSNGDGIYVFLGGNNVLTNNICNSNKRYGIAFSNIHSSYGITLSGNKMSGNLYNLYIPTRGGGNLAYHDIDTTNLVEGKPVYYIKNASNQIYDATTNAGMFACINCDNITIDGLTLTKNSYGLYLYNSQNSTIRNNTFSSNNVEGFRLTYSNNNTIYNNTFSGNSTGLNLSISINNTIYSNNFANNYSNLTNPDYYWSYGWRQAVLSSNSTGNIFTLPAPIGGNYWNNYDTATKGCSDLDGDGFCDAPYLFSGGQDNLPWTKQDGWKNSSSDSVAPTTTVSLSGTPGNNSWYLSDVQVTLTAIDNEGGSGVAKTEYSFDGANWTTYSAPFTVSAEGSTTVHYKSTDSAGNTETTQSLTVSIDKTLPTIIGTATTSPNANGWYNADITVHFTASDNISGINTVTPDTLISSEGASQSVSGTAFDMAGNSASTTVAGINIDKTAPVITITSPMAAKYDHSATISISFTATDIVSGIYKNTVYLDGQQYNPSNPISLLYLPLGIHTLKVESENYAGLMAAQSVDFEIIATASGTTSLVTMLYQTGAIDNAGIATSLTQQLQAAQVAISSGQTVSAQNILEAFINMLDAQSGKHISLSAAEILMADALYMIGQL